MSEELSTSNNIFDNDPDLPMDKKEARHKTDQAKGHILEFGILLLEIHDRRGWLALGYKSFEEYGQKEFQKARNWLYEQMKIAEVRRNITEHVDKHVDNLSSKEDRLSTSPSTSLPNKIPEKHLLAVANLPAGWQRVVLEQAYAQPPLNNYTGRPKVTTKHIEEVAERFVKVQQAPNVTEDTVLLTGDLLTTKQGHHATVQSIDGGNIVIQFDEKEGDFVVAKDSVIGSPIERAPSLNVSLLEETSEQPVKNEKQEEGAIKAKLGKSYFNIHYGSASFRVYYNLDNMDGYISLPLRNLQEAAKQKGYRLHLEEMGADSLPPMEGVSAVFDERGEE